MTGSATCAIDEVPCPRTVTDTYDYDAFGNKINSTGTTPNNYLYRAEMYDSDLGLYYLRARYMNPLTGRFMSRDPNDPKLRDSNGTPIDPKNLHKYLYAGGDPVNMIDPMGREEEEEESFLYTEVGATAEEIKKFIVGPVLCAAGVDVYAISVLNGGNAMDNLLGGATTAAGCAALLLGW
jgi:RHS repeat-associated protein